MKSIASSKSVRPAGMVCRAQRDVTCRASSEASAPAKAVARISLSTDKVGSCTLKGTVRKMNEDRLDYQIPGLNPDGSIAAYLAVFDGHGGNATSDWLENEMYYEVQDKWDNGKGPKQAINKAFRVADSKLLQPSGFMGMGERGIGGSKCGSTAAVAFVYQTPEGMKLLASNVGDSRILLARGGEAVQLTTDHVPDDEDERARIEAQNPNPRMPLVRFVGETWRVGGLLALSRAFGDAYMKGSMQFEGISSGMDDYGSGFGVTAEPSQQIVDLGDKDSWVIVCSDGLFSNEARGGGGGLTNQQIVDVCDASSTKDPEQIAEQLCLAAQAAGSTDDVSVVIMKI